MFWRNLNLLKKNFNSKFFPISTPLCTIEPTNLGQFGVYNLEVAKDKCEYSVAREPVNTNLCKCHLFYVFVVYMWDSSLHYFH